MRQKTKTDETEEQEWTKRDGIGRLDGKRVRKRERRKEEGTIKLKLKNPKSDAVFSNKKWSI